MASQRSNRNVVGFVILALVVLAIVMVAALAAASDGDLEGERTPRPTQPTPMLEMTRPTG